MRILALDTATESCSAALLINGRLAGRELELGRGHAEHILPMIDEVLAEAGTTLGTLDAIAFGRGPGGFTGVRLAASVTQGLAFGAGLLVIPVSDLAAVAQRAVAPAASDLRIANAEVGQGAPGAQGRRLVEPHRVIVCNDARMREVYWACFEHRAGLATLVGEERVAPPDTVTLPSAWTSGSGPIVGAGRGFSAYPHLRTRLESRLAAVHDRLLPRAQEIALLAVPVLQAGQAVTPEQAVPVYLRDEVAQRAGR